MNLWHQRVIIFLAKAFGVIIGLLILGYFLYYNLYFKTDTLIKYVPKEAVLYTTLRLSPELQQNPLIGRFLEQLEVDYNLQIDNFDFLNQLVGNNLSISLIPNPNDNSQIESLLLFDLGLRPQNIQKYQQIAKDHGWVSYIFSNQTKSRNILAFTSSQDLLEQVKLVAVKQKPDLSQKIEVVFNLKKFSPDKFFGKLFIDRELLNKVPIQNDKPEYKLISSYLLNDFCFPLYAGLVEQNSNIYIQNNQNLIYADQNKLSENMPADMAYYITLNDLSANWNNVLTNLKQDDLESYNRLTLNLQILEGMYNLNLEQDILPLVINKTQIFVSADNHYLLSLTLDQNQADSQVEFIEKLIKIYIANNYPVEKQRQLPDKTYITSIVRDIEQFKFKEDEVLNLKIKSIYQDQQEFIYILYDNHLILANSRDIIISLLDNDQKINTWKNTGLIDNLSNFSENAWINLDNTSLDRHITSMVKFLKLGVDQNTNNFWLILE